MAFSTSVSTLSRRHSAWFKNVFEPVIDALPREERERVDAPKNTYTILSVISAGMDAAGRVMELTSPLALAGIPIFFISTYYSDFIMAPTKEKLNVVGALQTKGYELSDNESDFISPAAAGHTRTSSDSSSAPRTPPPSNEDELQTRAFELLRKRKIEPYVVAGLELVQCSGREVSQHSDMYNRRPSASRYTNGRSPGWVDNVDTKLYTCMVSALVSQPRFISITLAQDDPPSLLIDRTLLSIFGDSLVGDTDSKHVPIFLDLVSLPSEVTGIVCGVAGKLVQDMHSAESSELSYLSTARAGAVILPQQQSQKALDILMPMLSAQDGES